MASGRVESVWVERLGGSVTADVAAGTQVIPVGFPVDFDETGGQLEHQPTGTVYDYTTADPDGETVTLAAPLPAGAAFTDGDAVYVWPPADDAYALVRLDDAADDEEPVTARISAGLRPVLAEGTRLPGAGEAVTVVEGDDGGWTVTDLPGTQPAFDGAFIDPATLPAPAASDGVPPVGSPTPVVTGGIGSLFVRWDAEANPDPVTYEVHVSTTPGFTPGPATLSSETSGTLASLRTLPDGTALDYATTYHVRLVAKDADGPAPAGPEATGSPAQVTGPDIAVGSVTTDSLVANAVTVDKLAALILAATKIYAPTADPASWRLEIGDPDRPIQWWNGTDSGFYLARDPSTGQANVYVDGRVDFGAGSSVDGDYVALAAQQATGWQTPRLRQTAGTATSDPAGTQVTVSWPSATNSGSLLVAYVFAEAASGTIAPAITAPGSITTEPPWTLLATVTQGARRLSVWKSANAGSRARGETFTFDRSAYYTARLAEFTGVADLDVPAATASGTTGNVATGTTAVTTQAAELWFAVGAVDGGGGFGTPSNGFTSIAGEEYHAPAGVRPAQVTSKAAMRAVTATGQATTSWPLTASSWLGLVAAFKAKPAAGDPDPPAAGVAKLYVKDAGGVATLHGIDSAGATWALGPHGAELVTRVVVTGTAVATVRLPAAGTIPQTYSSLLLVGHGGINDATDPSPGSERVLRIRFNGDTAMVYTYFTSGRLTNGTFIEDTPAGTVSSAIIARWTQTTRNEMQARLPGYTDASGWKGFGSVYSHTYGNNTVQSVGSAHCEYQSAAPVTYIELFNPSFNFEAGSSFELYGLR